MAAFTLSDSMNLRLPDNLNSLQTVVKKKISIIVCCAMSNPYEIYPTHPDRGMIRHLARQNKYISLHCCNEHERKKILFQHWSC